MSWYQERYGDYPEIRYLVSVVLCLNVGWISYELSASAAEGAVLAGEFIGASLAPAIVGGVIGLIVWVVKGKNTPCSVLIPEYIFYTAIVMIALNGFLLFTR